MVSPVPYRYRIVPPPSSLLHPPSFSLSLSFLPPLLLASALILPVPVLLHATRCLLHKRRARAIKRALTQRDAALPATHPHYPLPPAHALAASPSSRSPACLLSLPLVLQQCVLSFLSPSSSLPLCRSVCHHFNFLFTTASAAPATAFPDAAVSSSHLIPPSSSSSSSLLHPYNWGDALLSSLDPFNFIAEERRRPLLFPMGEEEARNKRQSLRSLVLSGSQHCASSSFSPPHSSSGFLFSPSSLLSFSSCFPSLHSLVIGPSLPLCLFLTLRFHLLRSLRCVAFIDNKELPSLSLLQLFGESGKPISPFAASYPTASSVSFSASSLFPSVLSSLSLHLPFLLEEARHLSPWILTPSLALLYLFIKGTKGGRGTFEQRVWEERRTAEKEIIADSLPPSSSASCLSLFPPSLEELIFINCPFLSPLLSLSHPAALPFLPRLRRVTIIDSPSPLSSLLAFFSQVNVGLESFTLRAVGLPSSPSASSPFLSFIPAPYPAIALSSPLVSPSFSSLRHISLTNTSFRSLSYYEPPPLSASPTALPSYQERSLFLFLSSLRSSCPSLLSLALSFFSLEDMDIFANRAFFDVDTLVLRGNRLGGAGWMEGKEGKQWIQQQQQKREAQGEAAGGEEFPFEAGEEGEEGDGGGGEEAEGEEDAGDEEEGAHSADELASIEAEDARDEEKKQEKGEEEEERANMRRVRGRTRRALLMGRAALARMFERRYHSYYARFLRGRSPPPHVFPLPSFSALPSSPIAAFSLSSSSASSPASPSSSLAASPSASPSSSPSFPPSSSSIDPSIYYRDLPTGMFTNYLPSFSRCVSLDLSANPFFCPSFLPSLSRSFPRLREVTFDSLLFSMANVEEIDLLMEGMRGWRETMERLILVVEKEEMSELKRMAQGKEETEKETQTTWEESADDQEGHQQKEERERFLSGVRSLFCLEPLIKHRCHMANASFRVIFAVENKEYWGKGNCERNKQASHE